MFYQKCQHEKCEIANSPKKDWARVYDLYLPHIIDAIDKASKNNYVVIGFNANLLELGAQTARTLYHLPKVMGYFHEGTLTPGTGMVIFPVRSLDLGHDVPRIVKHEIEHSIFHMLKNLTPESAEQAQPINAMEWQQELFNCALLSFGDTNKILSQHKNTMSWENYKYFTGWNEIRSFIKEIQEEENYSQKRIQNTCQKKKAEKIHNIWQILDCTKIECLTGLINNLAKVEPRQGIDPIPFPKPIAENILNIIEKTIDEATVGDMFGHAHGLLDPITPGGFEDKEPTVEDVLEAMMDAIKGVARESGINIDGELEEITTVAGGGAEGFSGKRDDKKKETLIREVEDYLFKMLGVSL